MTIKRICTVWISNPNRFQITNYSKYDDSQPPPGSSNLLYKSMTRIAPLWTRSLRLLRCHSSVLVSALIQPSSHDQVYLMDLMILSMIIEYTTFKVLKASAEALRLPKKPILTQLT